MSKGDYSQIIGINSEIRVEELWFWFTALFINVCYQCLKFQVDSFYSLEVMARKKIRNKSFPTKFNKG